MSRSGIDRADLCLFKLNFVALLFNSGVLLAGKAHGFSPMEEVFRVKSLCLLYDCFCIHYLLHNHSIISQWRLKLVKLHQITHRLLRSPA